jgi:hypothetical protein
VLDGSRCSRKTSSHAAHDATGVFRRGPSRHGPGWADCAPQRDRSMQHPWMQQQEKSLCRQLEAMAYHPACCDQGTKHPCRAGAPPANLRAPLVRLDQLSRLASCNANGQFSGFSSCPFSSLGWYYSGRKAVGRHATAMLGCCFRGRLSGLAPTPRASVARSLFRLPMLALEHLSSS